METINSSVTSNVVSLF